MNGWSSTPGEEKRSKKQIMKKDVILLNLTAYTFKFILYISEFSRVLIADNNLK